MTKNKQGNGSNLFSLTMPVPQIKERENNYKIKCDVMNWFNHVLEERKILLICRAHSHLCNRIKRESPLTNGYPHGITLHQSSTMKLVYSAEKCCSGHLPACKT